MFKKHNGEKFGRQLLSDSLTYKFIGGVVDTDAWFYYTVIDDTLYALPSRCLIQAKSAVWAEARRGSAQTSSMTSTFDRFKIALAMQSNCFSLERIKS